MPLGLILYRILTNAIAPFLGAFFRRRARAEKEDLGRIAERFAKTPSARPSMPVIWFHAASVGESQLLLEIAQRLLANGATQFAFLFTCQTQTAAALIQKRLMEDPVLKTVTAIHQMAPVDTPGTAKRFVAHWRPRLAIFAEGEVWPNLLLELERTKTPAVLINARMTEKSILGWLRWKKTARRLFGSYRVLIAADLQTQTGLENLSGQEVFCPGNLKSALPAPTVDQIALNKVKASIGERSVLLAASTHAGEEALVLDALSRLSPAPFLIIAPRHPERGDEIDALLSCTKLAISRRSTKDPISPETDILLADTMGEMGLWYRLADTVYLGGGHAPGVGGHNPLEALRLEKPILTGPSLFNFSDLSERLQQHQGFTKVADTNALIAAYPPAPVSQEMLDMLETDAIGPMSKTLEALAPLIESAGSKE